VHIDVYLSPIDFHGEKDIRELPLRQEGMVAFLHCLVNKGAFHRPFVYKDKNLGPVASHVLRVHCISFHGHFPCTPTEVKECIIGKTPHVHEALFLRKLPGIIEHDLTIVFEGKMYVTMSGGAS